MVEKYFVGDDDTQNHLVLQTMNKYFRRIAGVSDGGYIYFWKSKSLSDENISSINASNNSITPKFSYLNAEITVNDKGSCLKQDKINTYTHGAIINIYNPSLNNFDSNLEHCLFGAVKLTKTTDIDKYKYSGYCIGFDSKGSFFIS